jgi:hypothetical protein
MKKKRWCKHMTQSVVCGIGMWIASVFLYLLPVFALFPSLINWHSVLTVSPGRLYSTVLHAILWVLPITLIYGWIHHKLVCDEERFSAFAVIFWGCYIISFTSISIAYIMTDITHGAFWRDIVESKWFNDTAIYWIAVVAPPFLMILAIYLIHGVINIFKPTKK